MAISDRLNGATGNIRRVICGVFSRKPFSKRQGQGNLLPKVFWPLAIICSVGLSGCGTMSTSLNWCCGHQGGIYKGVEYDLGKIMTGKPLYIVDLPLSAVADTAVLPLTLTE